MGKWLGIRCKTKGDFLDFFDPQQNQISYQLSTPISYQLLQTIVCNFALGLMAINLYTILLQHGTRNTAADRLAMRTGSQGMDKIFCISMPFLFCRLNWTEQLANDGAN